MKNKKISILLLAHLFFLSCVSEIKNLDTSAISNLGIQSKDEIPGVRLDEKYFIIHYNTEFRIATAIEYTLTSEHLGNSFVKRRNHFHPDSLLPNLKIFPMNQNDYKHTGYDRGHLAPSGDFEWSEDANEATFTMANITPQKPNLNRIAWAGLEEKVRLWACAEDELKVVTGPVFESDLEKLNVGIAVPKKFFKVILNTKKPLRALGFIMNQSSSLKDEYKSSVFSVAEVEKIVGFHFFSDLSKEDQDKVKFKSDLSKWVEKKCKGTLNENKKIYTLASNSCPIGELKSASISGCCSHHGGVMGPKKYRACCDQTNRVICNDYTISPSCNCQF